jgi:cytochrome b subunit of formate dehydrogenase
MSERKSRNIFVITWISLVVGLMMMSSCVKVVEVERDIIPYHVISENINTCEDIIEWMNEDIFNEEVDSTYYESYIYNLEIIIQENRELLQN